MICSSVVGVHEIPVDILDLSHGGDDLRFESEVSDLEVALGDADVALIGGEPETGEQGLLNDHLKVRNRARD